MWGILLNKAAGFDRVSEAVSRFEVYNLLVINSLKDFKSDSGDSVLSYSFTIAIIFSSHKDPKEIFLRDNLPHLLHSLLQSFKRLSVRSIIDKDKCSCPFIIS